MSVSAPSPASRTASLVSELRGLCLYMTNPTHLTHFLRGWGIYLDCSLECLIPSESTTICSSFAFQGSEAKILVCIGGDGNVRFSTTTRSDFISSQLQIESS